jgi:23S rRNA (adenine2503-C2)-methyltransferase
MSIDKNIKPLYGLTLNQLSNIVKEDGFPAFTAKQIADWLYKKEISSLSEMTNLSLKVRDKLQEKYVLGLTPSKKVDVSTDGTKKYLFQVLGSRYVEAAYIPETERATLCLSTQAGCKMGCLFCMTGKQGFQGNLTTNEILNQFRSIPEFNNVSNIVYMGMGEPFDNLDNVLSSLEILTSGWGYAWSPKRITVSSIGIIPSMITYLEQSNCHLAISMHNPFDEERRQMMPIQNVYPIQKVIAEIKKADLGRQQRISFEYIMFDGVNDTDRHIKEMVRILSGLKCRVNLIRFHSIPDSPLKGTPDERIMEFRNALTAKGVFTTVRASRGQDIQAACGLLSTKEMLKKENPL